MLLSSKNDESDGNKTFEVYSSYITVASNIFKQRKTLIYKGSVLWFIPKKKSDMGAQWLSGRVLDSRPRGHGFEPHRHHCIVSLSKNIYPSLVLVQPRKTHPL